MALPMVVVHGSSDHSSRTLIDGVDAQSHRLIVAESRQFDDDRVAHLYPSIFLHSADNSLAHGYGLPYKLLEDIVVPFSS